MIAGFFLSEEAICSSPSFNTATPAEKFLPPCMPMVPSGGWPVVLVALNSSWIEVTVEHTPYRSTSPCIYLSLPLAAGVNFRMMNSCVKSLTMRSTVPMAKFPKTRPAPRFDCG